MSSLQRPRRRRFQGRLLGALTALAMTLSPPLSALDRSALEGLPTIVVDGTTCTLNDAILAANSGATVGGCSGSPGIDVLQLDADVVLTAANTTNSTLLGGAHAALPDVTSLLVIAAGTGSTIERDAALGCEAEDADSFRLLNVTTEGTLILFDVTLRGGCVAPAREVDGAGGGLYVDGGTLELIGVTVESNSVLGLAGASLGAVGGGLYCNSGSVPLISQSTFRGNLAQGVDDLEDFSEAEGGAAFFTQCPIDVIEDSLFAENEARSSSGADSEAEGGALLIRSSSDVGSIHGVTFENNLVRGGDDPDGPAQNGLGGALRLSASIESITASIFRNNRAEGGDSETNRGNIGLGGAIHASGQITSIRSTIFEGNTALGGSSGATSNPGDGLGGALYYNASDPLTITDSVFRTNQAVSGSNVASGSTARAQGGGFYLSGTLALVERCAFVGNEARGGTAPSVTARGGAIYRSSLGSLERVAHSTFTGNRAVAGPVDDHSQGGDATGGAIAFAGGGTTALFELTSNTFLGNEAQAGAGEPGSGMPIGGAIYLDSTPLELQFDNNLFTGNALVLADGTAVPEDCALEDGTITSLGYNLVEAPGNCTFATTGDQTGAATDVYEVADRGCLTPLPDGTCVPTVAIDQSSPAADQGSCMTAGSATDARETTRPFDLLAVLDADDACDIGAFEAVDLDGDGFTEAADCAPTDPSAAIVDACGACGGDGTTCLLFASGFETGDTGDWSATSP